MNAQYAPMKSSMMTQCGIAIIATTSTTSTAFNPGQATKPTPGSAQPAKWKEMSRPKHVVGVTIPHTAMNCTMETAVVKSANGYASAIAQVSNAWIYAVRSVILDLAICPSVIHYVRR